MNRAELTELDFLALGDYSGMTEQQVRSDIKRYYEVTEEDIDRFIILVAYDDGHIYLLPVEAYLLLLDVKSNKLFENRASHCSCDGLQGQFEPEEITLEYIKSDIFHCPMSIEEAEDRVRFFEFIEKIQE